MGGGTAGLVLAARLSESGTHTVGVLEAGGSGLGDPLIDVPGMFGATIASKYDCEFSSLAPFPSIWVKSQLWGCRELYYQGWERGQRGSAFDLVATRKGA